MNLEQFKNWAVAQGQVANPTTDPNSKYLGQCVSLVQQYINKVYGIAYQARGHAKDWPTNANVLSYFDKVNTIQPGDIIVYPGTFGGGYGHIAVALGNGMMLDQNGGGGLRVAIRQVWPGYSAILRRKGTVTNQQGDDMITANDRDPIRVISSEVKGWDFDQVHKGTWDSREVAAWTGRSWRDFIMQGWHEGAAFRAARNQKMRDYDVLAKQVQELSTRPTKAELENITNQLKASADRVAELEQEVIAAQNKPNEDSELLDQTGNWLSKLIARLFKK